MDKNTCPPSSHTAVHYGGVTGCPCHIHSCGDEPHHPVLVTPGSLFLPGSWSVFFYAKTSTSRRRQVTPPLRRSTGLPGQRVELVEQNKDGPAVPWCRGVRDSSGPGGFETFEVRLRTSPIRSEVGDPVFCLSTLGIQVPSQVR